MARIAPRRAHVQMRSPLASPTPPAAFLDTLLQMAPVDVLLFDTELVCRYAAPADDTLFGRTVEELVGRPAADIFPPAANGLGHALHRAVREAIGWRAPQYRYTHRTERSQTLYCWSVRVEPVAVDDYRGVLVTLADVQDLADENDRLHAEVEALHRREAALSTALSDLQAAVRTLLAPAMGYLQLIARRPQALAGRPTPAVVEEQVLPRLREVVLTVDQSTSLPDEPASTTG